MSSPRRLSAQWEAAARGRDRERKCTFRLLLFSFCAVCVRVCFGSATFMSYSLANSPACRNCFSCSLSSSFSSVHVQLGAGGPQALAGDSLASLHCVRVRASVSVSARLRLTKAQPSLQAKSFPSLRKLSQRLHSDLNEPERSRAWSCLAASLGVI